MSEVEDPRLLKAYRAATAALDETPGEHARAAILAAAARAAGSRAQVVRGPSRWRLPLAAAASLLIGTIAVMMAAHVEQPALPEAPTIAAVPATAETAGRDVAQAAAPADAGARVPEPGVAAVKREVRRPPSDMAPAPAAPDAKPAGRSGDESSATAAQPAAAGANAVAGAQVEADSVPNSAAAPAAATAERKAPGSARPLASHPELGARAAVGAAAEAKAAADAATAPETTPWRSAPATWIEYIAQLRAQERHVHADAELALLRARYPDLRLPPSVQRNPSGN